MSTDSLANKDGKKMHCIECGLLNSETAKFCQNCGQEILPNQSEVIACLKSTTAPPGQDSLDETTSTLPPEPPEVTTSNVEDFFAQIKPAPGAYRRWFKIIKWPGIIGLLFILTYISTDWAMKFSSDEWAGVRDVECSSPFAYDERGNLKFGGLVFDESMKKYEACQEEKTQARDRHLSIFMVAMPVWRYTKIPALIGVWFAGLMIITLSLRGLYLVFRYVWRGAL